LAGGDHQEVGHSLDACTQKLSAIRFAGPNPGDVNLVLIDTPGFDDTYRSDLETLKEISTWLESTSVFRWSYDDLLIFAARYKSSIKLSGILYFHRISENRMVGSSIRNLDMFESLCGKKNMKNVIFLTTMWDLVAKEKGDAREKELREDFFRPMQKRGALMARYDGNAESGWKIIDRFVDDRFATLLQRELVDLKKVLCETEAGRRLHGILDDIVKQQQRTADFIRKELDKLSESQAENSEHLAELQKDYEDSRVRMAEALEDMQRLDIPVLKRITGLLWLPRRIRGWSIACECIHSNICAGHSRSFFFLTKSPFKTIATAI
jgi:hypothetical protein